MKNLLFVIPTLRLGGAEKSLVSLLKNIDKTKYDIDLYLFEGNGVLREEVPKEVNVIEADKISRAMLLEGRYYFKDLVKSFKVGAIFAKLRCKYSKKKKSRKFFPWDIMKRHVKAVDKHYDVAVGYLDGVTDFFVIDKVSADKKIGWIHTDLSKRVVPEREKDYFDKFDHIATITEKCKDACIAAIPITEGKVSVVENIVISEELFEKAEKIDTGFDKGVFNIVTVGRLEIQKGVDIAVDAAKILKEKGLKFCWRVYGNGSMMELLKGKVIENGVGDGFFLEGSVDNPYPFIKAADIIVQPSRVEGKSIALDEAKILGKAMVVTNYPSAKDQIEDGKTGILVSVNAEGVADGVMKLYADKMLRNTLEENCKNAPNLTLSAVDKFYKLVEE